LAWGLLHRGTTIDVTNGAARRVALIGRAHDGQTMPRAIRNRNRNVRAG
jgi:hypothetical protein